MSAHQVAVIIRNVECDPFKPDQFEVGPGLESLVQH